MNQEVDPRTLDEIEQELEAAASDTDPADTEQSDGESVDTGMDMESASRDRLLDEIDRDLQQTAAEDAEERRFERNRTATGQAVATAQSVPQGALNFLGSELKGVSELGAEDPTESGLYEAGDYLQNLGKAVGPSEMYQGTVLSDIGQGVGTMGAMMGESAVGGKILKGATKLLKGLKRTPKNLDDKVEEIKDRSRRKAQGEDVRPTSEKIGQTGTASGAAGTASASETAQRAREAGESDETIREQAWLGSLAGPVEAANMNYLLKPFPKEVRKRVTERLFPQLTFQAGSEGALEGTGSTYRNFLEQTYNPETGLFDGVAYDSAIGAASAGLIEGGRAAGSAISDSNTLARLRQGKPSMDKDLKSQVEQLKERAMLETDPAEQERVILEGLAEIGGQDEASTDAQSEAMQTGATAQDETLDPQEGVQSPQETVQSPQETDLSQQEGGLSQQGAGLDQQEAGLDPTLETNLADDDQASLDALEAELAEADAETQPQTGVEEAEAVGLEDTAQPAESTQPVQEDPRTGIARVRTDQINVDPQQYQFRSRVNDEGVDDRLSGVKQWDDRRAGAVTLHRRKDGSLYVADGHHRVNLAKQMGQQEINANILDESEGWTVEDARVDAAMNNIADGKADPTDVAKVFRDSRVPNDEVEQRFNLPKSQTVRDGRSLANLSDNVFGMVTNEQISAKDGAAIGETFSDPAQQEAAADVYQQVQPDNDYKRRMLANEVKNAQFADAQGEQESLFGDDQQQVSLMKERLAVMDELRKMLNRNKRLFSTLNDNADAASEAGNVIETEANEQISQKSAQAIDLLDRVSTTPELNDMVNRATQRVADGEPRKRVVEDLKQELTNYESTGQGQEQSQSRSDRQGESQAQGVEPASQEGMDAGTGQQVSGRDTAGDDAQAQPGEQDPGLELESQTEESLREQEQTRQQREQTEQRQREQDRQRAEADEQVDDFQLTGSDRPADEAMAAGQEDLLTDSDTGRRRDEAPPETDQTQTESSEAPATDAGVSDSGDTNRPDPNPSDAQIEANNYKKGRVRMHGFDIAIENKKGETRSGTDADGNQWSSTMAADYGDIKGTVGADGDNLDVFVGPDKNAETIYVIDAIDQQTGQFDEHKVMMGFKSQGSAQSAYRRSYEKGWKTVAINPVTPEQFKEWVYGTELSPTNGNVGDTPFVFHADAANLYDNGPKGLNHFIEKAAEAAPDRFEKDQYNYQFSVSSEIFPEPDNPRNLDTKKGRPEQISEAEATERLNSWKAEAERLGNETDNSDKVILSLFDASGEIAKPWKEAGFTVIQYDIKLGDDLLEFLPTSDVLELADEGYNIVGILAQPPCTCFTYSGNQWWKERHDATDRAMVDKMFGHRASRYFSEPSAYNRELVQMTEALIDITSQHHDLRFWAMENPTGRIAQQMGLPNAQITFHPHHFGDPYTKKTQLWGNFDNDMPTANVHPRLGSLMHQKWSTAEKEGGERSLTPEGLAYSLFMANRERAMGGTRFSASESDQAFEQALEGADETTREVFYTVKDYVEGAAAEAIGQKAADNAVRVVPTYDQLPDAIRREAEAQGLSGEQLNGIYHKGKVYFVATNVRSRQELEQTLFHEFYGHKGLRAKYNKQFDEAMDGLLNDMGGLPGLLDVMVKEGIDLTGYAYGLSLDKNKSEAERKRILVEELLAHMSETTGSLRRYSQEILGAGREFARRMGFPLIGDMDAVDLSLVLRGARRAAAKGETQGGRTRFSQAGRPNLTAIHNLSAENLRYAEQIGGLPMPSIAVSTEGTDAITDFGEISLIAPRELADPAEVPVYSADAYSQRIPQPEYDAPARKDADALVSRLDKVGDRIGEPMDASLVEEAMIQKTDPQDAIHRLRTSKTGQVAFLEDRGESVEIPTKSADLNLPYSGETVIREFFETNGIDRNFAAGSQYHRDLSRAVETAISAWNTREGDGSRDLQDALRAEVFDGDGMLFIPKGDRLIEDQSNLDETRVDRRALRKTLEAKLEGRWAELGQWAEQQVLPLFSAPYLRINGKKVEYNADNLTRKMKAQRTQGGEQTMTQGPGKTRAETAQRFRNLERMRDAAEDSIASPADADKAQRASEDALQQYRMSVVEHYAYSNTFDALDASMRALGRFLKGNRSGINAMRQALKAEDFDAASIDDVTLEEAIEAAQQFVSTPVPYFEAKPRKAVKLAEFPGAVVPSDADQATFDALDRNLIAYRTYNRAGGDRARAEAVAAFRQDLATEGQPVLFKAEREKGLPRIKQGDNRVSTRFPTAVAGTLDPYRQFGRIDMAAIKRAGLMDKHAAAITQYDNYKPAPSATTAEKQLNRFRQHIEGNLDWLMQQAPQEVIDNTSRWYEGANRVTAAMAERHGFSHRQAAGVVAALSPQKDWFQNASLAERLLAIMANHQSTPWSADMSETMNRIFPKAKDKHLRDGIEGARLSDLSDSEYMAAWIRVFDQTYHDGHFRMIHPDGSLGGWVASSDGYSTVGWGSVAEIRKAVNVAREDSYPVISRNMGTAHKVRNFYNNIMDPSGDRESVTVDTHAVAAGLLQPLNGNSTEVAHNLGGSPKGVTKPGDSSNYGVYGTYGIFADAYRNVAKKYGLMPRQVQSVTWEMARNLFPAGFKTDKNLDRVREEWRKYRKGRQSLERTRRAVYELAGGIDFAVWARSDGPNHDPRRVTTYQTNVLGQSLRGDGGRGRRARAPGGDPRDTPVEGSVRFSQRPPLPDVEEATDAEARLFRGLSTHRSGSAGQAAGATIGGGSPRSVSWRQTTRARTQSGKAALVHRGSQYPLSAQDFTDERLGRASDHPNATLGVWFSSSRDDARRYGEPETFNLDLQRPKVFNANTAPTFESQQQAAEYRRKLQRDGYDGIVFDYREAGGPVHMVVFEPDQVIIPQDADVRFLFVGRKAASEKGDLSRAMELARKGSNNSTIRRQTGWFRGIDGQWRYEIDDSKATLLMAGVDFERTAIHPLADVLSHPDLFELYPRLKQMPVQFASNQYLDGAEGAMTPGGKIYINRERSPDNNLETLLHEIQHEIQFREDFAQGANPNADLPARVSAVYSRYAGALNAYLEQYISENQDVFDRYTETRDLVSYALMYRSMNRLNEYAAKDRPSGFKRLIQKEADWAYHPMIRENEELRSVFDLMDREWMNLPSRNKLRERNDWLRNQARAFARGLDRAIPDDVQQRFEQDTRKLDNIIKSLERTYEKTLPVIRQERELRQQRDQARRLSLINEQKNPLEVYMAYAGEMESRAVERRIPMNDEQRLRTPIGVGETVPADEAVVVFQDRDRQSVEIPYTDPASVRFSMDKPQSVEQAWNQQTNKQRRDWLRELGYRWRDAKDHEAVGYADLPPDMAREVSNWIGGEIDAPADPWDEEVSNDERLETIEHAIDYAQDLTDVNRVRVAAESIRNELAEGATGYDQLAVERILKADNQMQDPTVVRASDEQIRQATNPFEGWSEEAASWAGFAAKEGAYLSEILAGYEASGNNDFEGRRRRRDLETRIAYLQDVLMLLEQSDGNVEQTKAQLRQRYPDLDSTSSGHVVRFSASRSSDVLPVSSLSLEQTVAEIQKLDTVVTDLYEAERFDEAERLDARLAELREHADAVANEIQEDGVNMDLDMDMNFQNPSKTMTGEVVDNEVSVSAALADAYREFYVDFDSSIFEDHLKIENLRSIIDENGGDTTGIDDYKILDVARDAYEHRQRLKARQRAPYRERVRGENDGQTHRFIPTDNTGIEVSASFTEDNTLEIGMSTSAETELGKGSMTRATLAALELAQNHGSRWRHEVERDHMVYQRLKEAGVGFVYREGAYELSRNKVANLDLAEIQSEVNRLQTQSQLRELAGNVSERDPGVSIQVEETALGFEIRDANTPGLSLAMAEQEDAFSATLELTGEESEVGGRGVATRLYLEGLRIAQGNEMGWTSEAILSDASVRMYERLKDYGIPFQKEDGAYTIDADTLGAVDLDALIGDNDTRFSRALMGERLFKDNDPLTLKNPVHLSNGDRLSGFTTESMSVFHGYTEGDEAFTLRRSAVDPSEITWSRDSDRTATAVREALEILDNEPSADTRFSREQQILDNMAERKRQNTLDKLQFLYRQRHAQSLLARADGDLSPGEASLLETFQQFREDNALDDTHQQRADAEDMTLSELEDAYFQDVFNLVGQDRQQANDLIRYAGAFTGELSDFLEQAAAQNSELAFKARNLLNELRAPAEDTRFARRRDMVKADKSISPRVKKKLKKGKPVSRDDVIQPLANGLGISIYTGRLKKEKATYVPRKEIVRIRDMNDVQAVALEVAYLLNDRVPGVKKSWQGKEAENRRVELKALSPNDRIIDGFARFTQLYLMENDGAARLAPEMYDWFNQFLRESEYGPTLRQALADIHAWNSQDILDRARSKMGATEHFAILTEGWRDRTRQAVFDDLHGILRMEEQLYGEQVPAGPYESARLMRGASSMVEAAMHSGGGVPYLREDGSFGLQGQALEDILKPVSDDLDGFVLYAVGRSAGELMDQGRENLFTFEEIEAMQSLETPERKAAFEQYQQWNRQIVDFAEEMGIIDPEKREQWQRTQYIPFYRMKEDAESFPTGRRTEGVEGKWSGVKTLTGGTGNLNDILGNMVQNARMLIEEGVSNYARVQIADMAENMPGGGNFMARIPAESKPVLVTRSEIEKHLRQSMGIEEGQPLSVEQKRAIEFMQNSAESLGDFVQVFLHNQSPQGGNVMAIMREGQPVYYEIGDNLLLRSLKHFNRPANHPVVNFLSQIRRVGQTTVTLTPDFMAANLARDTLMASVLSRHGFKPFIDSVKGMKSSMTNDEAYREFVANGGGMSSLHADYEAYRKHLERFYKRKGLGKNVILQPGQWIYFLERLGESVEMGTRSGYYNNAIKRGEHPRHAAYLAREIGSDYAMRGDNPVVNFLYDSVLFLKAGQNGLDRIWRGYTRDVNKGAIAAKTGMLALASAMLYMHNRGIEEYEEQPDWVKDTHWIFPVPNGDGSYELFMYPKIWQVGMVGSMAERNVAALMDALEEDKTADGSKLAWDMFRIFRDANYIGLTPQVFTPLIEQYANKNSFTGAPIEPMGLQNLEPWARAYPQTNTALKEMGELTKDNPKWAQFNPVRAEALLRGYFNTWGMYGMDMAEMIVGGNDNPEQRWDETAVVRRFYTQMPTSHTKYQTDFYSLLNEVRQAHSTVNELEDRGRYETADEVWENREILDYRDSLEQANTELRDIRKEETQVILDESLTPEEKRRQMDALQAERNRLLRDVVKYVKKNRDQ